MQIRAQLLASIFSDREIPAAEGYSLKLTECADREPWVDAKFAILRDGKPIAQHMAVMLSAMQPTLTADEDRALFFASLLQQKTRVDLKRLREQLHVELPRDTGSEML